MLRTISRISFVEFGFLFAIFMAPWGPVLRYLGWLFAFIGLAIDLRKGKSFHGRLDSIFSNLLLLFLFWAFISTSLSKHDLYSWGKGISLAIEFAFSIWLAAYILNEQGALIRWKYIWTISIVLSLSHLFLGKILPIGKELFSNVNTTGIYACIIVPFVLSLFLENNNKYSEHLFAFLFWSSFLTLIISFSSAAWVSTGVALFVQLLLSRIPIKKIKILAVSFSCYVVVAFMFLALFRPSLGMEFIRLFQREILQLQSINNLDSFSTHRVYIWKGALNLIKNKPILGWGWGDFSHAFAQINASWWVTAVTGLTLHRDDAHSMYLNLAIYGGIPTTFFVLAIYFRAAWLAFKKGFKQDRYLYYAIVASAIGQLIYSIAGDMFSFRFKGAILFWTLLGVSAAKKCINDTEVLFP